MPLSGVSSDQAVSKWAGGVHSEKREVMQQLQYTLVLWCHAACAGWSLMALAHWASP